MSLFRTVRGEAEARLGPARVSGSRIEASLRELARGIDARVDALGAAELSNGPAGAALLFDLLERHRPDLAPPGARARAVERAATLYQERPLDLGLWTGIPGVAWAFQELGEDESAVAETVEVLEEALAAGDLPPRLELFTGPLGWAVFGGVAGAPSLVRAAVAALAARVERDDRGAFFSDPTDDPADLREGAAPRYVNLGLAHGVPAFVAGLAQVAPFDPAARELLRPLVAFLGAQSGRGLDGARYPMTVGNVWRGRSGWCYGDLGVALALADAGRGLGDAALVDEARATVHQAARLDLAPLIRGENVCHGSASLALLGLRLAERLDDEAARGLAIEWLARTLDRLAQRSEPEPPTLLMGDVGTSLYLLAVLTGEEPRWSALYLLPGPPSRATPAHAR